MKKLLVSSLILCIFTILSCINNTEECSTPVVEPINPNGDSELALLMREMFDDGMRMKAQIENGKKPEVLKKFEAIHTAEATEPEKAASDQYKVFADSYLAMMEALQNSSEEEATMLYKGMVETCMNCHRSMCPGPIVRIKKMYLSESN